MLLQPEHSNFSFIIFLRIFLFKGFTLSVGFCLHEQQVSFFGLLKYSICSKRQNTFSHRSHITGFTGKLAQKAQMKSSTSLGFYKSTACFSSSLSPNTASLASKAIVAFTFRACKFAWLF
jgi:hypothetical protein